MAKTAVVAGTATSVSNRVSRRQGRRWAKKDTPEEHETQAADYSQDPATMPANTDEQIGQLQKLGDLKDKGILTQAEFDQKKAEILRS